eukprot:6174094-Pleurochrysis_carterae.AAC.1
MCRRPGLHAESCAAVGGEVDGRKFAAELKSDSTQTPRSLRLSCSLFARVESRDASVARSNSDRVATAQTRPRHRLGEACARRATFCRPMVLLACPCREFPFSEVWVSLRGPARLSR